MKKVISAVMLLCATVVAQAQAIKLDDVENIKKGKIIVGLSGNSEVDDMFKRVIEEHWDFSEISEYMELDLARNKAKSDDNTYVLYLGKVSSGSLTHQTASFNYKVISSGYSVKISEGKKSELYYQFMPSTDEKMPEESVVFAVSSIQYLFKSMVQDGLKSNTKYKDSYKKHTSELKDKELYIMEGWIDTDANIGEYYSAAHKVVSYDTWRNAILEEKEGVVYDIIVPYPISGNYVYQHYLVDAADGTVYAIIMPKVAASSHGINMTRSNSGYINKKNLKMYGNALEGKW